MDEPLIRYKNVNINQQELGVLEDVNQIGRAHV